MKFGSLIKFYRTQKRITQKELANGICSISHLSKIENNSKEANIETITLLLKKLQIDFEEMNEKEELIERLLTDLNEKINYYQKKEASLVYNKLIDLEAIIPFSSSIYLFELYKYRYILFCGLLEEAGEQQALLNKQKKNFSQHEDYLFQYFNGVFLIMKGDYLRADDIFEALIPTTNPDLASGELIYHRALVKSALQESGYAIHFGKLALQSFMNKHNFIRTLHTLMLLGINYTQSKIYEEAEECFRHLARNAELINDEQLLPQIYHNMGFLQKKRENHNEALVFFYKSLKMQSRDSVHFLITMYCIGESYYSLKQTGPAREYFLEVLSQAKRLKNKKYELLAIYFLTSFDSQENSLDYLKDRVIPYIEDSYEHMDDLNSFYKLLSDHYINIGEYEEAIKFYKKMS